MYDDWQFVRAYGVGSDQENLLFLRAAKGRSRSVDTRKVEQPRADLQ